MSNLMGIAFNDWMALLRENRYSIDPPWRGEALRITLSSLMNSRGRRRTARRYGRELAAARVTRPVFILGHWRSGTTLLHNLLSLDAQFAFANLYEVSNPQTFLIREPAVEQRLKDQADVRRPMDEIHVNFRSPGEDESGLAAMCLRSIIMSWTFPRNAAFYDRFLTFCDATAEDVTRYKAACLAFFKALTFKYGGKALLLKSPTHTAHIRMLLELYPDARFIHLRRHPYDVFRSTQKLYGTVIKDGYMQHHDERQVDAEILARYQQLYAAFFEQRSLIPAGHLCELSYEDLDRDKVGAVASIYEQLGLDGFMQAEPALRSYVDSLAGYQKNRHADLDPALRQRIAAAAERCFDEWGYLA